MSKTPMVAVITRTKDRALLLERAIKSVVNQTYDNFVMVIVNDGGDPKIVDDLVDSYVKKANGRIKVIHNKKSIGMQPASNLAIKSVDSRYVVIHDDDDSWNEDFLKATTEHLEETGSMGVVVTTDRVDEDISNGTIKILGSNRLFPGLKFINLYRMCTENYATPISFIYRREAFKHIGYYDESLGGVGDWDFGLRFILTYEIDFLSTPEALAYYHHRPQATGINANSVYTDTHRGLENIIANKYLREDIKAGKLGIGYIINSLRYTNQTNERLLEIAKHDVSEQLNPVMQHIDQVGSVVAQLQATIQQQIDSKRSYRPFKSLPGRAIRKVTKKAQ